ncbi:hypothetical protein QIS74_04879 [Colletotrichum tabaci]|uniref:PD-(D/E)XK nuclease-like domain-containing protein n=1 Tax=Colletotrichum tabaci TaxID=1209068 RepID=A0AAV9TGZ3_9PEZI
MSQREKRSRDESGMEDNMDGEALGTNDGQVDEFATPRADRTAARLVNLSHASSQSSIQSTSTKSRTSSPRKQMRAAERASTGFVHEKFSLNRDTLPPSLSSLLEQLKDINSSVGILPQEARDELRRFRIPEYAFAERPTLVRYPKPGFVSKVLNRAAACDLEREGECSWNVEVHHPILSWVCRPDDVAGLVDFRYCTSATVLAKHQPKGMPSKMVDFCMIVRPPRGSLEDQTIDAVTDSRPGGSINHTDWGCFTRNPITLSIETKSTSEEQGRAILQMGIWHACQWRNIRELGQGCVPPGLEFLPGLLILGHEWFFVASVPGPLGQSVLYSKQAIGTTESEAGIYSILAALEVLRAWSADHFWPAFKGAVLGLS